MRLRFFFSFILSLLLLILAQAADDHFRQDCYPESCGSLANVTFPFWLRKLQPAHCGLPTFELLCEDDEPRLSEQYRVLNISYEDRTATVSSAAKFVAGDGCVLPYYNLPFALSSFGISPANRELVFYYNCTAPRAEFVEIDCHDNKIYAYLGGAYQMTENEGVVNSCYAAVMPVLGSPGAKVQQYTELLAKGFLLDWNAPDCSDCLSSNGQCGYNNNTRNFMCICSDRAHWRSCSERSSKTRLIIGLSCAGGVSFVMSFSICLLLCRRWKRSRRSGSSLTERSSSFVFSSKADPELGSALSPPIFSYNELYEATDGFSSSNELGDGGFGTVYKGNLRDGRVVAVKRLYENNYRRLEQFMNEVKILSLLRHQNLVSLYGCTSRRSRELLLVYEFVPNGTVADHLHGPLSSDAVLPWQVRMSIAIQTADALNYLHSVEPQIIHRDVKTNNILLDRSFHVKVADFGLSRLFPLDATHVSTAPQGTPGYVDPDYHQCFQLTNKSDVYSFGVVLMELISSKPAVDIRRDRHEVNLASFAVKKIQRQELHEFVDPRLGYHSDCNVNRMITMVASLSFRCLQADRETRPGIKEVVEILRGIEEGVHKGEGCPQLHDAGKEEESLLKSVPPCSPNSVMETWASTSSSISMSSR